MYILTPAAISTQAFHFPLHESPRRCKRRPIVGNSLTPRDVMVPDGAGSPVATSRRVSQDDSASVDPDRRKVSPYPNSSQTLGNTLQLKPLQSKFKAVLGPQHPASRFSQQTFLDSLQPCCRLPACYPYRLPTWTSHGPRGPCSLTPTPP